MMRIHSRSDWAKIRAWRARLVDGGTVCGADRPNGLGQSDNSATSASVRNRGRCPRQFAIATHASLLRVDGPGSADLRDNRIKYGVRYESYPDMFEITTRLKEENSAHGHRDSEPDHRLDRKDLEPHQPRRSKPGSPNPPRLRVDCGAPHSDSGRVDARGSRDPDEQAEGLGELITVEMGKPIAQSVAEVHKSAKAMRYYAENAEVVPRRQFSWTTPRRWVLTGLDQVRAARSGAGGHALELPTVAGGPVRRSRR